ncbi:MAG: hypothetical protein ACREV2_06660, partial [Burkholderiales bacterium]
MISAIPNRPNLPIFGHAASRDRARKSPFLGYANKGEYGDDDNDNANDVDNIVHRAAPERGNPSPLIEASLMPNAGCVNTRAYNARRARIVKNTFQTG